MSDPGAEFYAGQQFLYNTGFSAEDGRAWINRCIGEAFFNSVEICQSSGSVGQDLNIDCNTDPIPGRVFNQNDTCLQCQGILSTAWEIRQALEEQAVSLSGGEYQQQHLTGEVNARWNSTNAFKDPCRYVCNNCIVEAQVQLAYMHIDSNCKNLLGPQGDFTLAFQRQLRNTVAVEVVEKRKGMEKAKKNFDPGEVSTAVSNSVALKFKTDQLLKMFNLILELQEMKISKGSSSVVAATNIQRFTGRSVVQFVTRISQSFDFYDQTQIDQSVKEYSEYEGFDTLRDDLSHVVSSLSDLWKTVWGKLMLILVGVLMIIVLAMAGMVMMRHRRPWAQKP